MKKTRGNPTIRYALLCLCMLGCNGRGTADPGKTPGPGSPDSVGSMNDLVVLSATTSSVTLGFTEVDDGTGSPANYEFRFGTPPVSWDSASSVTTGTCASPVNGTSVGAHRTCTVLGLAAATLYQFQGVGFSGTLNQSAVLGPLSNVASASTSSDGAGGGTGGGAGGGSGGGAGGDTTAPVVSQGGPSGILGAGTTQATLSVTTDEAATCRWGTTDVSYANLPNTFGATGGTSHSATMTGLSDGVSYTLFVRCTDVAGNADPAGFVITFSVAAPGGYLPPDLASNDFESGTLEAGGFVNETPDANSIITDPTGVHGNVYRAHYVQASGAATADLNKYLSFNPTSGLGHGSTTFFRGYLYFPVGTPHFVGDTALRKLTYWRTDVPGGNQIDLVLGMFGNSAFVDCSNGPTQITDLNIFTLDEGRWYLLEEEVHLNSAPGVADGSVKVYVDGVQRYFHGNIAMTRPVDPASTRWFWLTAGHQREGNSADVSIDEERYWDKLAFSTTRIGP